MERGVRMKSKDQGAGSMSEARFRFENMEVWQRAAELSMPLFDLAETLDARKYFRFGEQLRAATLSITNNMAEGSGSDSDDDFSNFLKFARRSVLRSPICSSSSSARATLLGATSRHCFRNCRSKAKCS